MRNERENIPFDKLQQIVTSATNSSVETSAIIPIGQVNEVYDVKLGNGENVIVRVSRRGGDILEHERWALDTARQVGIPTPETLFIDHMETEAGSLAISVQEKIDGVQLSQLSGVEKEELLGRVGNAISRIHEIRTQGFGWTNPNGVGMYTTWGQYLARMLSKTERLLDVASRNQIASDVMTRALKFIEEHKSIYTGEARLVHRDLGPDHLLVRDGNIVGVIDFENCIGGDPVYDLARWNLLYGDQYSLGKIKEGYTNAAVIEEDYELRLRLYTIHAGLAIMDYMDVEGNIEGIKAVSSKITFG
ncbi:aminoglycoside phosphotransferase family protein [Candidatus Microgenomates bacterium]|nr:MAG: aminoglycoside phosphotransferase family protein [Candidatus Microgenomates bacterium]